MKGAPSWPPIVRDYNSRDKNFFLTIAKALNAHPRYQVLMDKLRSVRTANAVEKAKMVDKILLVMEADEREENIIGTVTQST
jgi:hypothetical protein